LTTPKCSSNTAGTSITSIQSEASAMPRPATMSAKPTYIGLRSQPKMPPVTSALDGFQGSTCVPAERKPRMAGIASAPPAAINMAPMMMRSVNDNSTLTT
jgi:hypothetical protein